MERKLMRLIFIGFVIGFLINLSLEDVFYKGTESSSAVHIDIQGFSSMNVSGNDLLRIKAFCYENNLEFKAYVSALMMENNFNLIDIDIPLKEQLIRGSEPSVERLYGMILDDLECFPVTGSKAEDINRYYYSNSFLAQRTYGGDRKHMGTDIMDVENEKGYLNIVSMTDGIVENKGWLELGGYRIGIRSDSGAYFYYAHLEKYAGVEEGDRVKAGDLLGYMGSTGYGPEGTRDQFDVHLHMGISIDLDGREFWVNPYAILQMLDTQDRSSNILVYEK